VWYVPHRLRMYIPRCVPCRCHVLLFPSRAVCVCVCVFASLVWHGVIHLTTPLCLLQLDAWYSQWYPLRELVHGIPNPSLAAAAPTSDAAATSATSAASAPTNATTAPPAEPSQPPLPTNGTDAPAVPQQQMREPTDNEKALEAMWRTLLLPVGETNPMAGGANFWDLDLPTRACVLEAVVQFRLAADPLLAAALRDVSEDDLRVYVCFVVAMVLFVWWVVCLPVPGSCAVVCGARVLCCCVWCMSCARV